jgi:uncharacterized membrane protein YedE/YeeE
MIARLILVFTAGLFFGIGLAVSGMTNPGRVIGFLDVGGRWDPSLAFVMAGAVGTVGVGLVVWRWRTGGRGWFGYPLPGADRSPIDRRLVIGMLVFGVGWGVSGFCPGPAIVNFGALRAEALAFVPAMAVGMLAARLCFGADRD